VRVIGWCEKCRKVKRVRVNLSQFPRGIGGIYVGVCDDCEEGT
jgi:hypothetical protein